MKLKASIKSGLITGFAMGLTLHWLLFSILYFDLLYEFAWFDVIQVPISILAVIIFLIALCAVGFYAAMLSAEHIKSNKDGFIVGAGAGFVATLVVYLSVGPSATTIVMGIIPFIAYLVEPEVYIVDDIDKVLKPIVKNAILATYLIMFAHFIVGAIIGGLQGLAFVVIRSWRQRRNLGTSTKDKTVTTA